jgi:hypothetical protein
MQRKICQALFSLAFALLVGATLVVAYDHQMKFEWLTMMVISFIIILLHIEVESRLPRKGRGAIKVYRSR